MKRWVVAIAALDVVLAILLAFGIMHLQKDNSWQRDDSAQQIGLEGMTEEERETLRVQAVGDALRMVSVQSECTARDGYIEIYFANRPESPCAAALEIKRTDTNQIIAQTDLLDPGYYLEKLELAAPIDAGEYQCLALFRFYQMGNDAYIGSGARQLMLKVE